MALIEWNHELEIGIQVIDGQHRRIVDYINDLHEAEKSADKDVIDRVFMDLIDYTYSHFAFEESLMDEAGYDALSIHKNTHLAFRERVDALKARHENGEPVAGELTELLQTWLLRHIMNDDTTYAPMVKQKMPRIESQDGGSWLSNKVRSFFN